MAYSRSFQAYGPPPSYDELPFTKARIEESAAEDGLWEVLQEYNLDPLDADPASPLARDFTTDLAEFDPGWYRFTWEKGSGAVFVGEPVYFPTAPEWTPSVAEVGALLRARTKARGTGGEELGTFTDLTRPSGAEVERLLDRAVRRVATAVGGEPCNASLGEDARSAAAIYAAMLVEQSYFPEQTGPGSSFAALNTLWTDQITDLKDAVAEQCGGQGPGVGSSAAVWHGDERPLIGPVAPLDW